MGIPALAPRARERSRALEATLESAPAQLADVVIVKEAGVRSDTRAIADPSRAIPATPVAATAQLAHVALVKNTGGLSDAGGLAHETGHLLARDVPMQAPVRISPPSRLA